MEVQEIQKEINIRVLSNNHGVVAQGVSIDTWKALEIPIDNRHAHNLRWNLYADFSANGNGTLTVTVAPSGSYDMKASYPLGDSVEDNDGWSYGTVCKYSC